MALVPEAVERLAAEFGRLPGIGPKTAQRMAFHLLQEGRPGARALVQALGTALDSVQRCRRCRMLTDDELCSICAAPRGSARWTARGPRAARS